MKVACNEPSGATQCPPKCLCGTREATGGPQTAKTGHWDTVSYTNIFAEGAIARHSTHTYTIWDSGETEEKTGQTSLETELSQDNTFQIQRRQQTLNGP